MASLIMLGVPYNCRSIINFNLRNLQGRSMASLRHKLWISISKSLRRGLHTYVQVIKPRIDVKNLASQGSISQVRLKIVTGTFNSEMQMLLKILFVQSCLQNV